MASPRHYHRSNMAKTNLSDGNAFRIFATLAALVAGVLLTVIMAVGSASAASPDTTAPTITGVLPAAKTTNVSISTNVRATFSEKMKPGSVNGKTFKLFYKSGTQRIRVAALVRCNLLCRTATLRPKSTLKPATRYVAVIVGGNNGMKDLAGNALAKNKAWSFLTSKCTIVGTKGNDVLEGTAGNDVICGLGGKDVIKGLGGNDTINGGADNDTALLGGDGNDTIIGGAGYDTASFENSVQGIEASLMTNTATGEGSDKLAGIEHLFGSAHGDTLTGSDTYNRLTGNDGNDTLKGLDGGDSLYAWSGHDTLHGGPSRDKLRGASGADNLFGEEGNDALDSQDGVEGNDSLDGGAGTDTMVTDATEASIVNIP
jgi:hypothetical protein